MKSREQIRKSQLLAEMRSMAMEARAYIHPSSFYGERADFSRGVNLAAHYIGSAITYRNLARR